MRSQRYVHDPHILMAYKGHCGPATHSNARGCKTLPNKFHKNLAGQSMCCTSPLSRSSQAIALRPSNDDIVSISPISLLLRESFSSHASSSTTSFVRSVTFIHSVFCIWSMPVTFDVMRRSSFLFSVAVAFLVLILAAASPLQRSHLTAGDESLASLSGSNLLRVLQRQPEPSLQEKRQLFNCTHVSSAFNSACWQQLQLSNFLLGGGEWGLGWNKSTRICDPQSSDINNNDGANCCLPDEPWTTCFLRLAQGGGSQDCSQINAQFCSMQAENALSDSLGDNIRPEVQYIQKNIYGIILNSHSLNLERE